MRLLGKFLLATGEWLAGWSDRTRWFVIVALCGGLLGASVFKLVTAWPKLGQARSPDDSLAVNDSLSNGIGRPRFLSPDRSFDWHRHRLDSLARIYPSNHPRTP